jgi:hypothetical protein
MQDPLHDLDARFALLDEPALLVLFAQAERVGDHDALGPLIRQLVLRAVPVVQRTIRTLGSARGFGAEDLRVIEEEALGKLMLRLQRGLARPSVRVLAHEIARTCAEDPRREPAPPPAKNVTRARLRAVPAPRGKAGSNGSAVNGHRLRNG